MDESELGEFVADNLHELAWHKDRPLLHGPAIWCALNGMKDVGFKVDMSSDPFNIFYVFQNAGKYYEMAAKVSREEMLSGWKRGPVASPKCLYDSIYLAIDRMQEEIKHKYDSDRDLSEAMFLDRTKKAHEARDAMEKHFMDYFRRYHEGFLTQIGGDGNAKPQKPRILPKLLRGDVISLDRINEGLRRWSFEEPEVPKDMPRFWSSNTWSTIAFLKDGVPLEEDMVVSTGGVQDYVWGIYLLHLAKMKRYPLIAYEEEEGEDENEFGMLEHAVDRGWEILEPLEV